MDKSSKPILIVLAFFSIYVIWGSTYLLNKIAVAQLAPFMLASVRFSTAGILILLLCKILKINLHISRQQFFNTILAGFLFLTIGNGVVVWALKFVDSGFAALVMSAQPLAILILMRIHLSRKIEPMSMVGVALGIFGIYLLVSQNAVTSQENSIVGIVMLFTGLISWAYGSLFVSRSNLPSNHFVNTAFQMLAAGILLAIASVAFGEEWILPFQWSASTTYSMVLLIVLGSIVAFTSFNYLLKIVSPEKVATSTYVNPIIAMLLGWYFLNETITLQSIMATTILLTGVYFINTKKKLVVFSRFSGKTK